MKRPAFGDDALSALHRHTFDYFWKETNPGNGLLADNTGGDAPASIAAVGYALTAYVVGVEHAYIPRARAVERTLTTLRFFRDSPQGTEPDATGYKGFYYHFLDMKTGRRVWRCELSTIDTAILLIGALTCAAYFDGGDDGEREIRDLADALYRRVDWRWAQNGGATVTHGWRPESGFLRYRWEGYNEGLLLYVLGLGSPTAPAAPRELRGLGADLSLEETLRHRVPVRRAALHPSTLPHLGRLPRHPGRLHVRARHRLLREQPPRQLRAAAVRDP